MKRNIISLLLLLIATCSWTQDKNASASAEMQRIPIDPIIVEGEGTGVSDGTLVEFNYRIGKAKRYSQANWVLGDTGRRNEMVPDYPPLHEFS